MQGPAFGGKAPTVGRLGAIDAVLVGVAGLLALIVVIMQFVLVPRFAAMFADFGGTLPGPTKLALQSWFGPAVALDTITFAALGVILRLKKPGLPGRVIIAAAIVQAAAAALFLLYALYAPIFALSSAVR